MPKLQVMRTTENTVACTIAGDNLELVRAVAVWARDYVQSSEGIGLAHIGLAAKQAQEPHNGVDDDRTPGHYGAHSKGICTVCAGAYAVRKDGTLIKHGKVYGRRTPTRCKGSLRKPAAHHGK
jgi:hypothetical protein